VFPGPPCNCALEMWLLFGFQDLTVFVQGLLQQMQSRFQEMSSAVISRIDEMGSRIDELERSISQLMEQVCVSVCVCVFVRGVADFF
jgi:heat shock factor-binding protein 1